MRIGLCFVGMCLCASSFAGTLAPPVGPVAPTMKTLQEIEPRIAINATTTPGDADSIFKITQGGSYYLTANVIGAVGKSGIEIAAGGVTVDLMGFSLSGGAGSGHGVTVAFGGSFDSIVVRNGTARSWGQAGIDLTAAGSTNCAVVDVVAQGNASNGIQTGIGSRVAGCTARENGSIGISTNNGCSVTGCATSANGASGVQVSNGCTVSGCASFGNGATGFSIFSGTSIDNCSSYQNDGAGISANNGCVITHCATRMNMLDGISVAVACLVLGNISSSNGINPGDGANIHVTSADNRIEGNNCTLADRGIEVDAAGNLIIRNSCSGNGTNWDIVANNVVGPILDRTAPASAAILGNSAPSSLGSTDANANYTY